MLRISWLSRVGTVQSGLRLALILGAAWAGPARAAAEPWPDQPTLRQLVPAPMLGAPLATLDAAFAWREVAFSVPHPADRGEALISLTPADPALPPFIWRVAQGEAVSIQRPVVAGRVATTSVRLVALGAFHGGLAPAQVAITRRSDDDAGPASEQLWGYVDAQGRWALLPQYRAARPFVGEVAVVQGRDAGPSRPDLRLINRRGQVLPWRPDSNPHQRPSTSAAPFRMLRQAGWTQITQAGSWVVMGPNNEVAGEESWLANGEKVLRLPGVRAQVSVDGLLWLLDTPQGPQLWAPERGFIALPLQALAAELAWAASAVPALPLAADSVVIRSRNGEHSAVVNLAGRRLVNDADVVAALTPKRWVACTSPWAPSLLASDDTRTLGPDLPNHRCGVLDEQGRWWAKPEFRTVERWGEQQVLLQGPSGPCLAELKEAALRCTKEGAPLPALDVGSAVPRAYRYVKPGSGRVPAWASAPLGAAQGLRWAAPFVGETAQVQIGLLPGLLNPAGQWLTPWPEGSAVARARQIHAATRAQQSPYAQGVIDRQGQWLVPPVFGSLRWWADGTLNACPVGSGVYDQACERLDAQGRALPPAPPGLAWMGAAPAGAKPAVAQAPGPKPVASSVAAPLPAWQAVAVNGRWGYQDESGAWVISPGFAQAEDFDGEVARAALLPAEAASAGQAAGETEVPPVLRWGLINRQGAWLSGAPRFSAIGRFQGAVAVASGCPQAAGPDECGGPLLGLIDRQGRWLAQPAYKEIGAFERGLAVAQRPDGSLCRLRPDGRCEAPGPLVSLQTSEDRWAVASQRSANGQALFGYLDAQGQWAIKPRYQSAQPFVGERAIASAEVPPLEPGDLPRWVTTGVERPTAGTLVAVTGWRLSELAATAKAGGPAAPANAPATPAPRVALADGQGRWLIPQGTLGALWQTLRQKAEGWVPGR